MYVTGCVTIRKIKIVLCRCPFLLKAQVLKSSTWKDVQNRPDTNMKRKEFSQVLKPKIMGTCKSEPAHQYHPKSRCQSMQIEHRGNIFIPTGNNTFWVNCCSCRSRQATDIFFTVDQYTKGKEKWKSVLFPWVHWHFRTLYTTLSIIENNLIRNLDRIWYNWNSLVLAVLMG